MNDALSRIKYRPDGDWNSNYGPFEEVHVIVDGNSIPLRNPILKHKILISVEATPDAPTWNVVGGKLESTQSQKKDTIYNFYVYEDESITICLSLNDPDIVEEYLDPLLTVHAASTAGACIELDSYQGLFMEDQNNCESIHFKGTLKFINSAIAQIRYTPPLDYNGQDSISLFASDGLLNVTATLLISVSARHSPFPGISTTTGHCIDHNTTLNGKDVIGTGLSQHIGFEAFVYKPNRHGLIVDLGKKRRCRANDFCSVGNFSIQGDKSLMYKLEVSVALGRILTPTHLQDIDSTYMNQMQTRLQMIGEIPALNKALRDLTYISTANYEVVDTMSFILSSLSIPVIFDAFLSSVSVDIVVEAGSVLMSLDAPSVLHITNEDEVISIEGISAHKSSSIHDKNKIIQASIITSEGHVRISRSLSKVKIHPLLPIYDNMWWHNISICGAIEHVNSTLGKISLMPVENMNSDSGDVVYISVYVVSVDDCETMKHIISDEESDDTVLIPVHVKAVNDGPVISLKPSSDVDMFSSENHTLVVEENRKLHIPVSVQDIDSNIVKVEVRSKNSGMIAVALNNLRDINAFFLKGDCGGDFYPHIGIQGTIEGVNTVLQNMYFMGKETNDDLEITASDLVGGQDKLTLKVYVQSVAMDLLLWFVVNADFKRPTPVFQEKEYRLVSSDWVERKDLYMEAEVPNHSVGPKYKTRRLSGPRMFTVSIGSDVDAVASDVGVCLKVVTDKGLIRIQKQIKSLVFETANEGKELRYVGDVFTVNKAAEAIIFEATDGIGGKVTLEITAIKGHCQIGTTNCYCNFDIPDARKGLFHLQVNRLNSPPRISWLTTDYMNTQPPQVALDNSMTLRGLQIQDLDASRDDILSFKISASKGVLSLLSIQNLSFMRGTGFKDRVIEVFGTLHAINEAIHEVSYTCRAIIDGCQSGSYETIHLQVSDHGFAKQDDKSILHIQIV